MVGRSENSLSASPIPLDSPECSSPAFGEQPRLRQFGIGHGGPRTRVHRRRARLRPNLGPPRPRLGGSLVRPTDGFEIAIVRIRTH